MKKCPKCGYNEFKVNAHTVETWLVDEDGDYITTTNSCVEVSHYPNDDDLWECAKCGYQDAGKKFEVPGGTDKMEISKERLEQLLIKCMDWIEIDNDDTAETFYCLGFDPKEIEELGFGYLNKFEEDYES